MEVRCLCLCNALLMFILKAINFSVVECTIALLLLEGRGLGMLKQCILGGAVSRVRIGMKARGGWELVGGLLLISIT